MTATTAKFGNSTENKVCDFEKEPLIRSSKWHPEPVWRQYMAALLGSLISMATGCVGGWSSAAVPLLMSGMASDLGGIGRVTSDEASWITSLMNLGSLVGSLPAGQMSFHYGRRKFLLHSAVLLIFGWLLIINNFNNVGFIYVGRFICGFVAGSVCVALSMYSNEICCDVIRGRSGVFYDMMQVFGILYVYSVNAVTTLFWGTMFCILIPVVFLLTFIWMPESPVYLISHGRTQEAVDCIRWLHGEFCDVDKHVAGIQLSLLEGKQCDFGEKLCNEPFYSSLSIRKFISRLNPTTMKTFSLILSLFVIQRSCGAPVIVYYAQDVFQYASVNISTKLATVYMGIAQVICTATSVILIDHVGRRILLLCSFTLMIISLFIFILYLILISLGYDLALRLGWIPVVTVSSFVGSFRLGVGPIPWFMCSELLPIEAQRWALPIIFFVAWSFAFICSKSYLDAVTTFGYQQVFIFFGIICVVGLLFTFFLIPETKNKSRAQIQEELGSSTCKLSDFRPRPVIIIEN